MVIGIIAAMKSEMETILNNMNNVTEERFVGNTFYSGRINDNEIVLCESGVGKVNAAIAATVLINNYEVNLVINTGIAGGLQDTKNRDVIIASGLMYHDFDIRIFGYQYGQVPQMPKVLPVNPELITLVKSILNKLKIEYREGIILSGDRFITEQKYLDNVAEVGALAVEMEGTAIAHVAVKAGVDFIVLRYISDVVGAKNQESDYLQFEQEMSDRSARICLKLIENI